jgi:hypothetical protein
LSIAAKIKRLIKQSWHETSHDSPQLSQQTSLQRRMKFHKRPFKRESPSEKTAALIKHGKRKRLPEARISILRVFNRGEARCSGTGRWRRAALFREIFLGWCRTGCQVGKSGEAVRRKLGMWGAWAHVLVATFGIFLLRTSEVPPTRN